MSYKKYILYIYCNMKKYNHKNYSLLLFISLLIVGLIIYVIISRKDEENYEIVFVDDFSSLDNEKNQYVDLMLVNNDGELEMVSFESINIIGKNNYEKIFSLYNEYKNSLPSGYTSPFNELILNPEITAIEEKLIIRIDKMDNAEDLELICKCLKESFFVLGINEIELNIGKTSILLK